MKNTIKTIFALILSLTFITCENSEEGKLNLPDEQTVDLNNLDLSNLNIDFNFEKTFNLNEISLDEIMNLIVKDLEFTESDNSIRNSLAYTDGVNINIKDVIVTISPLDPIVIAQGACGSGTGWTDYGTCMSSSCVKDKMEIAAADLEPSNGQCLDIRIKRNSFNARVCARLISC